MDDARARIAARVSSLRTRHWIFVGVFLACSAAAWALPASQAPITARAFISACLGAIAVWQVTLALRIGKGLAIVDASPGTVVWTYPLRAFINGAEAARGIMIGVESGARHELPIGFDPNEVTQALDFVRARCPRAVVGFDPATEARFLADPKAFGR